MSTPTAVELAYLAESRIWSALYETDLAIMGAAPSRVRDLAALRLRALEHMLPGLPLPGLDGPLADGVSDEQLEAAFGAARVMVEECLVLIQSVTGLVDDRDL